MITNLTPHFQSPAPGNNTACLQAQVLERLHVTIAPLIIGSGVAAFRLDPISSLEKALRPEYQLFRLGNDLLFDFDLSKIKTETNT